MNSISLFNEIYIDAFLEDRRKKIVAELTNSAGKILSLNPSDYAKLLADKYKLIMPDFDFDSTKTTVEPVVERSRRDVYVTDYVTYEIKYKGDKEVLYCKPKNNTCNIGYINVGITESIIRFSVNSQGTVATEGQPRERVKQYAQIMKDFIDCSIKELEVSIQDWNETLESDLYEGIKANRQYLQGLVSNQKQVEDDLNMYKKK